MIFEVALEEGTEEGKADDRECAKAQQGGGRESCMAWTRVLKTRDGQQGWRCEPLDRPDLPGGEAVVHPGDHKEPLEAWKEGTWATRCDAQSQVQTTEDK